MIASDQTPGGSDWISRRLAELERQVRELQAGRRLEAATIGRGGLTVKGGGKVKIEDAGGLSVTGSIEAKGSVRFRDSNDAIQVYMGPISYSGVPAGIGWFFNRANGNRALTLEGTDPNSQFMTVRDDSGNIIFSDDAGTGQGLARPYLPAANFGISLNAETYPQVPGVTSSTFTSLYENRTYLTHPRLRIRAYVGSDVVGTTAEGRITLDGTVIATSTSGWIDGIYDVPGWGTTVGFSKEADINLQVRRTGGTGRAIGQVYACYGYRSP
ncbi:hypothetical protein AB0B85_11385 [Micromonospora sp. NPDC049044]|uniref:hypothetical protein n=1 Tax=Micromonospora sp. NPDC049044 TaxID=3154827 RepID=UPI0033FA4277